MRILLIETCTERAVIAYGNSQSLLFEKELPFGLNQSSLLLPYLAEALQKFGNPPPLDVIGVGVGPGSYTGIRIGAAVAQALSYCWKVPVAGISSLAGFVPSETFLPFASVLDARIGGIYFQRGHFEKNELIYDEQPRLSTMEECIVDLADIPLLVTPVAKSLQTKFLHHYPSRRWKWEERAPSLNALMKLVENQYDKQQWVMAPTRLDLNYLRETEAEREAQSRKEQKQ